MNYNEIIIWIHSYQANGRRPSLNRMKALLEKLGNPQSQFPAVHIVGTNGKGSTTSFLQNILTASGYKTGTFTSPYITRFNERISVNGIEISDEDLITISHEVKKIVEDQLLLSQFGKATEFELVTLLMFTYFAFVNPVEIAVIEAGIGGTYDSTNVFKALAVICPSISFDHEETLGNTLSKIAEQKIGVLDSGVPFVFGEMTEPVRQLFYQEANILHAPTYELNKDFFICSHKAKFNFSYLDLTISDINLKMLGAHQQANASLAVMTSLILKPLYSKINPSFIVRGLEKTQWIGRSEFIKPNLMIDGAHNEESIRKLIEMLKHNFSAKTIHILFAGLERKPLDNFLNLLSEFDLTVTSFDFYQARKLGDYPKVYKHVEDYKDWVKQSNDNSNNLYIVTGSLYFISEVRNWLINKEIQ